MARKQLGANPANNPDAATKAYVDANITSGMLKPVRIADNGTEVFTISGGNVTQIAGTTLTGVSVNVGDRLLIQSAPATTGAGAFGSNQPANGIYQVTGNSTNLTVARTSDLSGSVNPAGISVAVGQFGQIYTVSKPTDPSAVFTYGTTSMQWYRTGNVLAATLDDIQTLTNKTLSNPIIDQISDGFGKIVLDLGANATAVNYLNVSNASAGSGPGLDTIGSDTNIDLLLSPKGTGKVKISGNPVLSSVTAVPAVSGTPSGTTYLRGDGTWATPPGGAGDATATPSTIALRDASANLVADNFIAGFAPVTTTGGTTTLTVDDKSTQYFTGPSAQIVLLPTTSVAAGQQFTLINQSSGALTINASGGGFVQSVSPSATVIVTALIATPTTGAHWTATLDQNSGNSLNTLAKRDSTGKLSARSFVNVTSSTVTAGGTTTLTSLDTTMQIFTGTSSQTLVLPTTGIAAGQEYTIINQSTGTIIVNASGGALVMSVVVGTSGVVIANVASPSTAANWTAQLMPTPSDVTTNAGTQSLTGKTIDGTTIGIGNGNTLVAGMLAPVQANTRGDETFTIVSGNVTQIAGTTISAAGYTPAVGDRILIPNAPVSTGSSSPFSTTSQPGNGIYVVTNNTTNLSLSRSTDMSGTINPAGLGVYSENGNWLDHSYWTVQSPAGRSVFSYGTTSMSWRVTAGLNLYPDSIFLARTGTPIGFVNPGGGTTFLQPGSVSGVQTLNLPITSTSDTLVGRASADTLTNKILTAPRIDQILDTNGNPILDLVPIASAVNRIAFNNQTTGIAPILNVTGSDTDINLNIRGKGAGKVRLQDSANLSKVAILDVTGLSTARTFTFPDADMTFAGTANPTFTGTVTVPAPSNSTDAATKSYVDTRSFKQSVRLATTGNETYTIASGTVTQINGTLLDGVTVTAGDRILVKDAPASSGTSTTGTTQPGNGIYTVTTASPNLIVSRVPDMTTGSPSPAGAMVSVQAGTANNGLIYGVSNPTSSAVFTYGSTSMAWGFIIPNSSAIAFATATFQNKTLDNTNAITIKDTNFTIQNSASATKQIKFDASALTGTKTFTLPDTTDTIVTLGATQTLTGKTLTTPVLNGLSTGTGVSTTATADTLVLRDSYANLTANAVYGGFNSTIGSGGTLTLNAGSPQFQIFAETGSTHTLVLPSTGVPAGAWWMVTNRGNSTISVQSSSTASVLDIRVATGAIFVARQANPTSAAHWEYQYWGISISSGKRLQVSFSVQFISAGDGLVFTFPSVNTTLLGTNTVTAKGDLYAATGVGAVSRLGVGTDGYVLTAASGQATGLQWAAPSGGGTLSPVRVATVGTETFTIASGSVTQIAGTTIDGVSPSVGDRILINDAPATTGIGSVSSTQPGNGVYTVSSNTTNLSVSRATDMSGSVAPAGLSVFVEAGTLGASSNFVVSTPSSAAAFTYGTGNIAWMKVGGGPGGGVGKFTTLIGDGVTTAIAVTHNLGTQDATYSIRDASTNAFVDCDVVSTSSTVMTFTFATAPASSAYKVVIIG